MSLALERTARLAQFLREAVGVRSQPVLDVARYPKCLWFADMPRPADTSDIRSPLFTRDWPEDDERWLVVNRVAEPPPPVVPAICRRWLGDIPVHDPASEPILVSLRQLQDDGSEVEVPPAPEALLAWGKYLSEKWRPWAVTVRTVRRVRALYEDLFSIHNQLQGQEDGYDVFVGVGLVQMQLDGQRVARRHLLAFPASIDKDDRTGTLTVRPSPTFVAAVLESEYFDSAVRANLQRQWHNTEPLVEALGPDLRGSEGLHDILKSLVFGISSKAEYSESMETGTGAPVHPRARFAPALIFRPRNPRALEKLLHGIEQSAKGPAAVAEHRLPFAWRQLIEDPQAPTPQPVRRDPGSRADDVQFPLPANEEQLQIVRLADNQSGVVVQGPPGTGKSHTIANLISHYLASGQRVLVTAEKAQALRVLRDKLPGDLKSLCVTLLGTGSDAEKALGNDVRALLSRYDRAQLDPGCFLREAEEAEREIGKLRRELTDAEEELLQIRSSEATSFSPSLNYMGTRATIARLLEERREHVGWIQDPVDHAAPCPRHEDGLEALIAYHAGLRAETREALTLRWRPLPFEPEVAIRVLTDISRASASSRQTTLPEAVTDGELAILQAFLENVQALELSGERASWVASVRLATFARDTTRWAACHREAQAGVTKVTPTVLDGICEVEVQGNRTIAEVSRDVARLDEHFSGGGGLRSWGVFVPTVIRETSWLTSQVRIDGAAMRIPEDVARLRKSLQCAATLAAAWKPWDERPASLSPTQQAATLRARADLLGKWLAIPQPWDDISPGLQGWLRSVMEAGTSTADVLAEVAAHRSNVALAGYRARRDELVALLPPAREGDLRVFEQVATALRTEDGDALRRAFDEHEDERVRRMDFGKYETFLADVKRQAPALAALLRQTEGGEAFDVYLRQLNEAWEHRCVSSWLERHVDPATGRGLQRTVTRLREGIDDRRAQAVAARAWHHAVGRIDMPGKRALVSWSTAVKNIPRTGRTVFARRAAARRMLPGALNRIPAWVVSLNRLYETVDAIPGQFDIAIVDEASQCGIEALTLFYLAKQVIVVGDDKQISPSAVGIDSTAVPKLADTLIPDLNFRSNLTLQSSLFDHGRAYLGHAISLREHFRCVPEIIKFSNELCYGGSLIPLRQAGMDRLAPFVTHYVEDGTRARDVNAQEARALVDALKRCHVDPRYEDATFGVICLQGDEQADFIERLVMKESPQLFEERRLRCGNPYAFQGDERNVIFLSMVAAPNVRNQTLSGPTFEQRFNVAMSRAQDQAWLFHSMREQDLAPGCLRLRLLQFFNTPPSADLLGTELSLGELQRLAARRPRQRGEQPQPFDSWFEIDVALALVERGLRVSAQVAVATKRIDLVVEGNGWRLAVECDGDAWHGPEQFLTDMHRQRQLERAGWQFVRVPESAFYADRDRALAEILEACEELAADFDLSETSVEASSAAVASTPGAFTSSLQQLEDDGTDEDQNLNSEDDADDESGDAVDDREPLLVLGTTADEASSGDPQAIYPPPRGTPWRAVGDAVMDIVTRHGPLTKASIYRRYRDGCPEVSRASKTLKTAVNRAVSILERSRKLVTRDEGANRKPDTVVVRSATMPWVTVRPLQDRVFDEIPVSELAEHLKALANGAVPARGERVRLFEQVLRAYGLKHRVAPCLERFEFAARWAFEREDTSHGESGLANQLPLL